MDHYALVASAEPNQLDNYARLVRHHGNQTMAVRDGKAAIQAFETRGRPQLVVMDLSLPLADGFAVLEALRRLSLKTAVVVVSPFLDLRNAALKRKDELGILAVLAPSMPVQSFTRAIERALRATGTEEAPENAPPRHLDEARLRDLDMSGLLLESLDEELQALCAEVARTFKVETALISLVARERQFFKAYAGLSGDLLASRGTPIAQSFCRHVVDADATLLVPDAVANPSFKDNELVKNGSLRGYAGVPLQTHDGAVLGTLCVLDKKPLALSADEVDALKVMGRHIAGKIALKTQRVMLSQVEAVTDSLSAGGFRGSNEVAAVLEVVLSSLETGVMLMTAEDRKVIYANDALARLAGIPREKILAMNRDEWIAQNCGLFDDPTDFMRKLRVLPHGPFAAREEFKVQRPIPRVIRWTARPLQMGATVVQLALYEDITATGLTSFQHAQIA